MSNIKFFSFNQAVQDETLITATSENAQFPVSNIKDPRTTKVSRSVTGILSNEYVFDMIATSTVGGVLVVPDSNRGFAGISGDITVKGNIINNDWGAAPFTTTITPNDTFGLGFSTFTDKLFRFWQLTFSNNLDFAEISKICIAEAVTLADNNIDFGWTKLDRDKSKFRRNRYGQRFSDKINRQDSYKMTFNLLNKDELDTITNMVDDVGETSPVWMIVDDNATIVNDAERFAGYFYFTSMPTITNAAFSLYNLSINVEQSM